MFKFINCETGEQLRDPFPALNTFLADGNLIESASGRALPAGP